MNLIEALETLKQSGSEAAILDGYLACGFTPLHFRTFLLAFLTKQFPGQRIQVKTGLFGDLVGNVRQLQTVKADFLVVVLEWQDLDPRLGIRTLGGWRVNDLPDIIQSAGQASDRLEGALRQASALVPTFVCLPTLPLPPAFAPKMLQATRYELQLRQLVNSLATSIADEPRITIVNAQHLDETSPPHSRLDVQSELMTGFPYQLAHASALAEIVAALIRNPIPKKGLITDLDDTLWAGILGEVGHQGISWHLDQNTHMHGVYQQFLGSLASAGVLIAVASKNDPVFVEQAFERKDLVISKDLLYPIEVHWSRKSESVQRILKAWNISPDAVVFIDDSPMEVAEVKTAFPDMECIVFPRHDCQAIWHLLRNLRNRFGKSVVSEEDSIRLKSIRVADLTKESWNARGGSLDDFLQSTGAVVRFTFQKQPRDNRAFELINKTNQFNLNGRRLTEAAWITYLNDPESFLITVSYEDKYGPLGKIAVLMAKVRENGIQVDFWVMSCRAFSRRIEHQCLKKLFEKFGAKEICFDYQATAKNGPLQEFFADILGAPLAGTIRLSKAVFEEKSPALFHRVEELVNG